MTRPDETTVTGSEGTARPSGGVAMRALRRVAIYFAAAAAAIAIAADLSGLSQWYESHGKNTVTAALGAFAALAALVMLGNHAITKRDGGEGFFARRGRAVEFGLLLVVSLGMFGIRIFDPQTDEPPIVAEGFTNLANAQGIDLDIGQARFQDVPGVDLSPSATGQQLNAMTHGSPRFAVAGDGGGSDFERCSRIAADAWSKVLLDAYDLRVGGTLCVRTDQGNLAALSLTHVPSAAEQHIAFTFTTWQSARQSP